MKECMNISNVVSSAMKLSSSLRNVEAGATSQAKTNDDLQKDVNDMMQGHIEKMQVANKNAILKMADKMKESAAEDEDGEE